MPKRRKTRPGTRRFGEQPRNTFPESWVKKIRRVRPKKDGPVITFRGVGDIFSFPRHYLKPMNRPDQPDSKGVYVICPDYDIATAADREKKECPVCRNFSKKSDIPEKYQTTRPFRHWIHAFDLQALKRGVDDPWFVCDFHDIEYEDIANETEMALDGVNPFDDEDGVAMKWVVKSSTTNRFGKSIIKATNKRIPVKWEEDPETEDITWTLKGASFVEYNWLSVVVPDTYNDVDRLLDTFGYYDGVKGIGKRKYHDIVADDDDDDLSTELDDDLDLDLDDEDDKPKRSKKSRKAKSKKDDDDLDLDDDIDADDDDDDEKPKRSKKSRKSRKAKSKKDDDDVDLDDDEEEKSKSTAKSRKAKKAKDDDDDWDDDADSKADTADLDSWDDDDDLGTADDDDEDEDW